MIDLVNLEKVYESTRAGLSPFKTQVPEGQWVALIGPSGCGKSTLLKLLAGLETPSSGAMRLPCTRAQTSFVFQEPALLPWKTVLENVLLPITLREGKDALAAARARAEPWLQKLRLEKFAHRYPDELSGGMRMRVSLARALVTQPKLLLLDEPFAALDEPIRIELGLELRELWKQLRPTVFFVTHSITEALWLADRVIVLHGQPGSVILDETLPFGDDRALSLRGSRDFLSRVEKCFELLRGNA